MSKGTTSTISGFNILPVQYAKASTHFIYARLHQASKNGPRALLPINRTLFLVNLPPDATERELITFFRPCGTVERVLFDADGVNNMNEIHSDEESDDGADGDIEEGNVHERPRKKQKTEKEQPKPPTVVPLPTKPLRTYRKTGESAHLVFLDETSLPKALLSGTKPRPWPKLQDSDAPPTGLAHYMSLYASLRPPLDVVRAHADSSMALYEYEIAKSRQRSQYRKGEAIVDEDGFTLVTRGGAYGKTLGGGVGVASKNFQSTAGRGGAGRIRNKRKEPKEKESFYAFQKAEKQRKDLMNLKRKWDEDKAKVDELRASRRFKPY